MISLALFLKASYCVLDTLTVEKQEAQLLLGDRATQKHAKDS